MRRTTLALALGALLAPRAAAHEGPPYPILVDEVVAGYTLSIWADPDVGTGTFYYYVDAPEGHSPTDVRIEVRAEPTDKLAPEVRGFSETAEPREPFQLIGKLPFAHRGEWPTTFLLHPAGDDERELGRLTYDLSVTPPGLGPADILLYAFPFLVVGGLWLRILLANRAHRRGADHPSPVPPSAAS